MRLRRCLPALALLGLAACQDREPAAPSEASTDEAATLPSLPVAEPPLDREALLLVVARAASAVALGQQDPGQAQLDGRPFELRMRFGCGGPGERPVDSRRASFDEGRRVLRISVTPDISATAPALGPFVGAGFEDAEGFWVFRPWLLQAACLPGLAPEAEVASEATGAQGERSEQTAPHVGIAQFFTATDARTHRRDRRAYAVTKVLAAGERPSTDGYDLVVGGRLRQLADGRVVACTGSGTAAPPTCILSAEFDRVAVETPGGGPVIAEWSTG